jgi:hypothetical protein
VRLEPLPRRHGRDARAEEAVREHALELRVAQRRRGRQVEQREADPQRREQHADAARDEQQSDAHEADRERDRHVQQARGRLADALGGVVAGHQPPPLIVTFPLSLSACSS